MEDKQEFTIVGNDYKPTGTVHLSVDMMIGNCRRCPAVCVNGSDYGSIGDLAWLSCPVCHGTLIWRCEPKAQEETTEVDASL